MTFENLTGQTINGLHVDHIEGREPLRWRCHCTVCQVSQVHTHLRLRNRVARCSNVHCAPKSAISERDQLELERAKAEQAREQAIAKEIEAEKKREAARSKAVAERNALLTGGYLKYWHSCLKHNTTPMTLDQWRQIAIVGREKILEFVDKGWPVHATVTEYVATRTEWSPR